MKCGVALLVVLGLVTSARAQEQRAEEQPPAPLQASQDLLWVPAVLGLVAAGALLGVGLRASAVVRGQNEDRDRAVELTADCSALGLDMGSAGCLALADNDLQRLFLASSEIDSADVCEAARDEATTDPSLVAARDDCDEGDRARRMVIAATVVSLAALVTSVTTLVIYALRSHRRERERESAWLLSPSLGLGRASLDLVVGF